MKQIRNSSAEINILIVEDDLVTKEVLTRMISHNYPDVKVHVAGNGQSALDLCVRHSPDIVITDINMPVLDGIQMAKEIQDLKPDMKFIILTGYSDRHYLEKVNSLGISDYILKPIEIKALFITIDKYIHQVCQERNIL